MAAGQVTATYSGTWGNPIAVVLWSVALTVLGFASHYWDVGALPGKGYANGTLVLVLLNVIAALAICTWLHRASALARMPLVILALGAYLRYPPTASDSTWYLISLNLSHSLLPRFAIALVTVGVWFQVPTLVRWVLASGLLILWEPLVWLVMKDFVVKPRLQYTWATLEDWLLLLAILAPVSWCARSVTSHSADTIRRQLRHLIAGLLGLSACVAMLVVGNKIPKPNASSVRDGRPVKPRSHQYTDSSDVAEIVRQLREAQAGFNAAERSGSETAAAQWLLRRNALDKRLRALRAGE